MVELIDGDEYRANLCNDLGFSKEDRNTNIRRLGFVSKVLSRNNVITIIAAINPYEEIRKELIAKDKNLKTVYIKCDVEQLIERDVKGLYKKALLPDGHPDKVYNFTGISDPFEEPTNPDLVINTAERAKYPMSIDDTVLENKENDWYNALLKSKATGEAEIGRAHV